MGSACSYSDVRSDLNGRRVVLERIVLGIVINMKDEDKEEKICNEALAWMLSENAEMYREIVKSLPGGAAYFREQWEQDIGKFVDVSSFTDDEIIDATFEINKLRTSGISEEGKIRDIARILRIDSRILH